MWKKAIYSKTLHFFTKNNGLEASPTACGKLLFISADYGNSPATNICKICEIKSAQQAVAAELLPVGSNEGSEPEKSN